MRPNSSWGSISAKLLSNAASGPSVSSSPNDRVAPPSASSTISTSTSSGVASCSSDKSCSRVKPSCSGKPCGAPNMPSSIIAMLYPLVIDALRYIPINVILPIFRMRYKTAFSKTAQCLCDCINVIVMLATRKCSTFLDNILSPTCFRCPY